MSAPLSPPDLFDRVHPTRLLLWGLLLVFTHHLVVGLLHTWDLPLLLNATAATTLVLIALPLLHLRSYRAEPIGTLRIHPISWGQAFWLALLALAVIPPAHVLGNWNLQLIPAPPALEEFWAELVPQSRWQWIATLFALGVVVPIGEEIVFRGIVQQAARKALGGTLAIAASGALFALVHFEPWYLMGLFLIGLTLSLVYEKTGSLLAPILVHSVYNMAAITASWWQLQQPEGAEVPTILAAVTTTVSAAVAWTAIARLRRVRAWQSVELQA